MSKTVKIVGAVAIVIFVVFAFLYAQYGHFLFRQIKTVSESGIVDSEYQCSNSSLKWKIKHYDLVAPASYSIDNPHGPRPYTDNELTLWNENSQIARFATAGGGGPFQDIYQAHQGSFSTGEAFTRAYVLRKDSLAPLGNFALQYEDIDVPAEGIEIPASKITAQDFDVAATCFSDKVKDFNILTKAVGWLMRVDDSIKRESYLNAPEFVCANGQNAYTNGPYLDFLPVGTTFQMANMDTSGKTPAIGRIGFDGKLYNLYSDQEVPFPDAQCTNSDGTNLKDYIASIPNRITILNLNN